jgi:hypothetical protein
MKISYNRITTIVMKKKFVDITKKELQGLQENKISRKEALKKTGFIVLSAATTMVLLKSPAQAAASPAPPPPGGGRSWR